MNSDTQHHKVTIYEAQASLSFKRLFKEIVSDMKPARELGLQLAKRDIKAAYRQSILGIIWAFIPPIVTSAIWIILNSSNTVSIEGTAIPYPAFVLIGTLLWQILTESVTQPLKSVTGGKSILSKLNFPRESLLLHAFYTVIFNTLLKLPIMAAVLIVFGINPGWQGLLFIPFVLAIILMGLTIGLIVLPVGMMYGDISRMIPFAMQFLMYLTPVIFPMPKEGMIKAFNSYNPFAFLIETSRNLITAQELPYIWHSIIAFGICSVILGLGVIVYRFIMPIIIERVGA
nr:ABC transporter permease [uncultured Carboxylicivirga sp.]